MSPEIREFKQYDGTKSEVFALGVVLFIFVVGHLPFLEACKNDDIEYGLLAEKKFDEYWEEIEK